MPSASAELGKRWVRPSIRHSHYFKKITKSVANYRTAVRGEKRLSPESIELGSGQSWPR